MKYKNKLNVIVFLTVLAAVSIATNSIREHVQLKGSMQNNEHLQNAESSQRRESTIDLIIGYEAEVDHLVSCVKQNDCQSNLDVFDSREGYYRLCRKLLNIAEDLKGLANLREYESVEFIAKKMIIFGDCNVDLAGLDLLTQMPSKSENLSFITAQLANHYDGQFIDAALKEMSRFTDDQDSVMIDDFLITAFQQGSYEMVEHVAQHLELFISESNVLQLEQVIQQIPRNSQRSRLLRTAISTFRLSNSNNQVEKVPLNRRHID